MTQNLLKPGDYVERDYDDATTEVGIVVAVWLDDGLQDCYVAFYGEDWPEPDKKPEAPYILRYYASSLRIAKSAEENEHASVCRAIAELDNRLNELVQSDSNNPQIGELLTEREGLESREFQLVRESFAKAFPTSPEEMRAAMDSALDLLKEGQEAREARNADQDT